MTSFHPISIFMDARRITRGAPEMIVERQQKRLNELVAFARTYSRFYAEKYRRLPETITDVRQLPPVTKIELMEHFDETTRARLRDRIRECIPTEADGAISLAARVWATRATVAK